MKTITSIIATFCLSITVPVFSDGDHKHTKNQGRGKNLFESGDIKVIPKFKSDVAGLKDSHYLSMVVVEITPNNTEPTHTHPGEEILFGVSGSGAVVLDGVAHQITPGTVIHVKKGQTKALSNTSTTENLKVLAYLVLEKGKPVLKMSE